MSPVGPTYAEDWCMLFYRKKDDTYIDVVGLSDIIHGYTNEKMKCSRYMIDGSINRPIYSEEEMLRIIKMMVFV